MIRKTVLTATAAAGMALLGVTAQAQEMGKVISSTPVIQQVAVPRQVCSNQQVVVPQQKSGGGAAIGAIAGGAIGNSIGDGGGRALATMIGLVGGAILGDKIEGAPAAQTQNVQQCSTQTFYENRTVAYNVTYEFAGKQYNVQMPSDPGPYVKLQITPVSGANSPQAPAPSNMAPAPGAPAQTVLMEPAVVMAPTTVVYADPYYYRPYYPPVGVSLNLGYSRGYYRHGPWGHWR